MCRLCLIGGLRRFDRYPIIATFSLDDAFVNKFCLENMIGRTNKRFTNFLLRYNPRLLLLFRLTLFWFYHWLGNCSLLLSSFFRFLLLVAKHVTNLKFICCRLKRIFTAEFIAFNHIFLTTSFIMWSRLLLALFSFLHCLLCYLDKILKIHDFLLVLRYIDYLAKIVCIWSSTTTKTQLFFVWTFNVQVVVVLLE